MAENLIWAFKVPIAGLSRVCPGQLEVRRGDMTHNPNTQETDLVWWSRPCHLEVKSAWASTPCLKPTETAQSWKVWLSRLQPTPAELAPPWIARRTRNASTQHIQIGRPCSITSKQGILKTVSSTTYGKPITLWFLSLEMKLLQTSPAGLNLQPPSSPKS